MSTPSGTSGLVEPEPTAEPNPVATEAGAAQEPWPTSPEPSPQPEATGPPAVEPPPPPQEEDQGPPPEEGAPAWVMTFGDLMSLLLTFFILLFSMSSIEVEKFQAAAASLQEAFGDQSAGVLPGSPQVAEPDSTPLVLAAGTEAVANVMEDIGNILEQFVVETGLQEQVAVTIDDRGVFLRIEDRALFTAGSATIGPGNEELLESLSTILTAIRVPVIVSGHTDDRPIRSRVFQSNWELSAARAAGVARGLVQRGLSPDNITAEAYGEYRPVATNDTPEGRAQNRRVEVYYSRQAIEDAMRAAGMLEQPTGDGPDATPGPAGDSEGAAGATSQPGAQDPPAN